jgi:hypothetical protein
MFSKPSQLVACSALFNTHCRPASWGDANCAGVPGENADGVGSYCEKYSVLTRLEIDLEAGTAVEAADLLVDQCGGSTTHGAGGINFAKNGA